MPAPETNPLFDPARDVVTDAASLQGLAHPVRLRLLGLLRRDGPSTASKLADELGISSGLSSYHLRQLAAAGHIVPAESGERRGRERWWAAARRSTHVGPPPAGDAEAAALTADYLDVVLTVHLDKARRWLATEHDWPAEWQNATDFSDLALALTPEQTRQLKLDLAEVLGRYPRAEAGVPLPPGAVAVAAQYQVFPDPGQPVPGSGDR